MCFFFRIRTVQPHRWLGSGRLKQQGARLCHCITPCHCTITLMGAEGMRRQASQHPTLVANQPSSSPNDLA